MQPRTFQRYNACLTQFLEWCRENKEDATSVAELDELMCDYIHDLYFAGGSLHSASNALSALGIHLPESCGHMLSSSRALKGWRRLKPPKPWPPMTYPIAVSVAVSLSGAGFLREAIGVLLAFECYLRVGELVGLRREDVAAGGDVRLGGEYSGVALRLRSTKTGVNQWVTVRDPEVAFLLLALVRNTSPHSLLFPTSTWRFRQVFKKACSGLGVDSVGFVPHSLRHGGATRDFLRGMSLESILARGRWASTKSARHYIQSGRALLLSIHLPLSLAKHAAVLATSPAHFVLSSAPSHRSGSWH